MSDSNDQDFDDEIIHVDENGNIIDSKDLDPNLTFAPISPGVVSGAVGLMGTGVKVFKMGRSAYANLQNRNWEGFADAFNAEEVQDLKEQFKTSAQGLSKGWGGGGKFKGPSGYKIVDPPSGGGSDRAGRSTSAMSAIRLNIEPHPVEVRMDTGIKPEVFTPDYNFTETGYNYPVFYTGAKFTFPTTTTTLIGSFWSTSILSDLKNVLQRNINYSVSITNDDLTNFFNYLSYALQVYYAATRYATYMMNSFNRNEGIVIAANSLTTAYEDDYRQLRRMLNGLPIPENLNNYIFFLMQHYLASEEPDSPVIGFTPFAMTTGGLPDWSCISTAVSNMTGGNFQTTCQHIGRAFPAWYGTELLTGSAGPLHDPNFTTIWANAPYIMSGVSPTHDVTGPPITDTNSKIYYNSWTENLDGGAFAMTQGWTGSQWHPGLLTPVTSSLTSSGSITNRYHFDSTVFKDSYYDFSAVVARDETYCPNYLLVNTIKYMVPLGVQRVWGVTARVSTQACYNMLDWLMSWTTITSKTDKSLQSKGPLDVTRGKFTGNNSNSGSNTKHNNPKGKSKRSHKPKRKKE